MQYFLFSALLLFPVHSGRADAARDCQREGFHYWGEIQRQKNMAGAEGEQENSELAGELEVLQAIYGDDVQSVFGGAQTEVLMTLGEEGIGLQFVASEHYPADPPSIHVCTSEASDMPDTHRAVLVAHLQGVAKASVGEPMLHTLITEAKDFVATHLKDIDISRSSAKQSSAQDNSKPVCKFFLEGKCRFGENCHNRHPQEGTTPKTVSGRFGESKTQDRECIAESRESERKGKKKPPMRTAQDVINRIQWDEDLVSKNFVIGYLDRFTGVQERPFDDFTWGDLSAAEIDDLAIPQHRIQYFKYHDEKIWDKNERLDNVFGSTGSYVTIHDVIQKYKKEDEKESAQEKEEVAQAGTEGRTEDRESSSDEDDFNTTTPTKRKSINKNRPNYFVAVRITNPDVLDVVKDFQTRIFQRSPVLDAALIPAEKLHVTLCTLRIDSQRELDSAIKVLRDLKTESARLLPPSLVLKFNGVKSFHGRVLYAAPEENAAFCKLAAQVSSRLRETGLHMAGGHDSYVPHLTLLKLSHSKCEEMQSCNALSAEGVDPSLYDQFVDQDFGAQAVDELHLCSMSKDTRHDGFYQCAASVGLFDEN